MISVNKSSRLVWSSSTPKSLCNALREFSTTWHSSLSLFFRLNSCGFAVCEVSAAWKRLVSAIAYDSEISIIQNFMLPKTVLSRHEHSRHTVANYADQIKLNHRTKSQGIHRFGFITIKILVLQLYSLYTWFVPCIQCKMLYQRCHKLSEQ